MLIKSEQFRIFHFNLYFLHLIDEYVEAKCDYTSDSFTFKEGDILTIINRTSDGFAEGTVGTLKGTFPVVLVKPFDNNPGNVLGTWDLTMFGRAGFFNYVAYSSLHVDLKSDASC